MALVIRSNARRKSPMGALFVSNPKKRKKANPKRRKNGTKKGMRRKTARRAYLKSNPLKLKRRKNAAHTRKKNALALARKRKNAAKKAAITRKKNALALKRKKNALALKRRKKNGTKKGMRRKTARRAYLKRRRNGAYKRNPVAFVRPVEKAMKKVPLLKQAAPYLGGAVVGMMVAVPYQYAFTKVNSALQNAKWAPKWVKSTMDVGGMLIVGLGFAALSNYALKKSKLTSAAFANSAAGGIAVVAGAAQFAHLVQLYQAKQLWFQKGSSPAPVVEQAMEGLAFMGDGGAYDVVPMAGAHMNGAHMNGAHMAGAHHMNGAHMNGAHMGAYGDASMVDAKYVGNDISPQERLAANGGMHRFMSVFGQCPYKSSSHDGSSRYAGKHGHRWGWLIKILGWNRFAQLCRMSAPDRIRAISQIKIAAINAAQQKFDSGSKNGYAGIAMNMGGLAYESDSLSGVAMIGAAH